jgi:hypothetical protein
MDGLIKTAWRAFWVGLGASAVLIGQTLLASPPPPPRLEAPSAPLLAPASAPAAVQLRRSTDPALSRIPRCETVSSVLRCT